MSFFRTNKRVFGFKADAIGGRTYLGRMRLPTRANSTATATGVGAKSACSTNIAATTRAQPAVSVQRELHEK
jgi:hypothetical protein